MYVPSISTGLERMKRGFEEGKSEVRAKMLFPYLKFVNIRTLFLSSFFRPNSHGRGVGWEGERRGRERNWGGS